ncbi:hypothetical protein J4442_03735 [Candidatus Woesearchaeota archaeon]|nr:hypothetical protein [Candidatus Woesearchaeota archaeon]
MKLQKQLSRKVGGVEYAKWVLVIPPNVIEESWWSRNLNFFVQNSRRLLNSSTKPLL